MYYLSYSKVLQEGKTQVNVILLKFITRNGVGYASNRRPPLLLLPLVAMDY